MVYWLLVGGAALGIAWWAARVFVTLSPGDLARAVRTFIAVFGGLAGTGLLLMGRFGLAVILIAATVMAVRALVRDRRPPDPIETGGPAGRSSDVATDLLDMRLDHQSGELDGMVRRGPLAGSRLSGLDLVGLRALYDEARASDPASVALLEAYLDRRFPDWRTDGGQSGASPERAGAAMDERTALGILGLAPGADADAIRAAHRRLMARLHPDHGGSDWLAARINEARDFLLKGR